MKEPENMDDLLYFTRRNVDNGKIMAWVYKTECPKCKKALMGKPIGDKGKVAIRAKEYVCPECNYQEEKKEHEEARTLEGKYTCPHCGKEGEGETPYKRKSFQGVQSYLIECQHCSGKIPVTKKMKEIKKK